MIGTVFRIEHEDTGRGCYKGLEGTNDFLDAMYDKHANPRTHPNPYGDVGIGRNTKNYEFCGFKSMEQLKGWFTDEELSELGELGYKIVELADVEITAIGEKQILFIKPEELDKKLNPNFDDLIVQSIWEKDDILLDIAF